MLASTWCLDYNELLYLVYSIGWNSELTLRKILQRKKCRGIKLLDKESLRFFYHVGFVLTSKNNFFFFFTKVKTLIYLLIYSFWAYMYYPNNTENADGIINSVCSEQKKKIVKICVGKEI